MSAEAVAPNAHSRRRDICREDSRARATGRRIAEHRSRLDAVGEDEIYHAILDGQTLMGIAEAHGVTHGALLDWISRDDARAARMVIARQISAWWCDDRALHRVQTAADEFDLQKAREEAIHLRWRASKIAPRVYGDKLQVDSRQGLSIDIRLGGQSVGKALTIDAPPTSAEFVSAEPVSSLPLTARTRKPDELSHPSTHSTKED